MFHIEDINEVEWRLDTMEDELLRCDIGLVPGIIPISDEEARSIIDTLEHLNPDRPDLGSGPYLLRFKGFSNAGRSFVFHQLGIPAIACFMPSHFHILGDPDCGFLAHSTDGWLTGLRTLCSSAATRRRIAKAARREFDRHYDPLVWARRLHTQINSLCDSRR